MGQDLNMGSTLQSVTNAGNTTTNDILIKSNKKIIFVSGNDADVTAWIQNLQATSGILTLHGALGPNINIGSNGLGIGDFGTSSSIFSINSTSKGSLLSRMTTTQKNAIATPSEGLIVYDLTLHKLCVYTGAAWETITSL